MAQLRVIAQRAADTVFYGRTVMWTKTFEPMASQSLMSGAKPLSFISVPHVDRWHSGVVFKKMKQAKSELPLT
jgi:hypothetical protein